MAREYPIPVTGGGNLLTQPAVSLENVGDANYSIKVNLRRQGDQEIRQEGWVKFFPNPGQPVAQQYIFDGALQLTRLAEIVRGDGTRVIVGASQTEIKMFNTATSTWVVIGSGFSAQGLRWQVEDINGYLVMNNAVDLPVYFFIGNAAVTPLYEMRDVGIASVKRITQLNGFLFVGGVISIDSDQLNKWMTGYPSYVPGFNVNENANFASNGSDSTTQYNVTTGASALVLTLPGAQPPPTWWIIAKKVDAGAGSLVTTPVIGDQTVNLVNVNDTVLIWSDGVRFFSKYFAGGAIPAANPYGAVPADIVNNIPYRTAWSTPGQPTNWAPAYSVYMAGPSATLRLPFATPVLKVGDLVAVVGGGPGGGTLGGNSAFPQGVPITAINGALITLAESTDTGITYPCFVTVLRFADIGTFVGFFDVQGDGSSIITMLPLTGKLQIYKETSIFICNYVAIAGAPFTFIEKYVGYSQPLFADAVVSLNGQYHLYPGEGNRFYVFDGLTSPILHTPTDNARNLFFSGINNESPCWVIDNPITKQIWFCRPGLVFAFDYLKNTVSEIDAEVDAAVFCKRPLSTDDWLILGMGGNVYTTSTTSEAIEVIQTWLRDGQPAVPQIGSGLMAMGKQGNEKLLLEYTPLLSSPSPDLACEVQIWTTYNPSGALAPQMLDANNNPAPAQLPDPAGNNYIPTAFQAIYFQDLITVIDARDMDFRFSGRFLVVQDVNAGSITRTSN